MSLIHIFKATLLALLLSIAAITHAQQATLPADRARNIVTWIEHNLDLAPDASLRVQEIVLTHERALQLANSSPSKDLIITRADDKMMSDLYNVIDPRRVRKLLRYLEEGR